MWKRKDIEECTPHILWYNIQYYIPEESIHGRPWQSGDFYWNLFLLIVLTLLNAFFSATEMSMVSLNRSRVVQKQKKGIKIHSSSSVWNSPTISYPLFRVGITFDYHLVWGDLQIALVILLLDGWAIKRLLQLEALSLAFSDLYFDRIWGTLIRNESLWTWKMS